MQFGNESSATASRLHRTGHMTSSQVTKTFTSITSRIIKIKPWAKCHYVCFEETYRLICNMTHLGHSSGQIIWPGPRSDFQIDLIGSRWMCFDASRRVEHDSVLLSICFVQKLFTEKLVGQKWPALGRSKILPEAVKSGMIGCKIYRTFRSSLLRSSIAIRWQTSRSEALPPHPRCVQA